MQGIDTSVRGGGGRRQEGRKCTAHVASLSSRYEKRNVVRNASKHEIQNGGGGRAGVTKKTKQDKRHPSTRRRAPCTPCNRTKRHTQQTASSPQALAIIYFVLCRRPLLALHTHKSNKTSETPHQSGPPSINATLKHTDGQNPHGPRARFKFDGMKRVDWVPPSPTPAPLPRQPTLFSNPEARPSKPLPDRRATSSQTSSLVAAGRGNPSLPGRGEPCTCCRSRTTPP